ncbi:MAG: TIGR00730 family Rossman fold protein [Muribaculaceae bacterium]|nr:TIGR00730 family Rossman fold protein [Muribaculaceae bacterium]
MKRETRGNVCVFCASSANIDSRYLAAARELGALLARDGWRCVNGGGAVGLMGAVTDGALDAEGEVTGVIPKFMVDNGWCYDRLEDVIITADMHQRKQMMSEMADAVIALPGGVGTLEELLETLTWRQLGLVKVPVIILNTLGYYDGLLAMLGHAIDEGFMKPSHAQLWQVATTPYEALALLNDSKPVDFESKY